VSERHVAGTRLSRAVPRDPRRSARLPHWGQIVAVALGGAVGAPLRYQLGVWFPVHPGRFPLTTLCENVSGAFVLGILLTLIIERIRPARYLRAFACTGVLGAYTTFSTFALEVTTLTKDGHAATAVAYVLASLGLGLVAAVAGVACARLGRQR
jgi:CrcB protein